MNQNEYKHVLSNKKCLKNSIIELKVNIVE